MPHAWNIGIVEWWKVENPVLSGFVFKLYFSIHWSHGKSNFTNNPLFHLPKTHYSSSTVVASGYFSEVGCSIIPIFQL